MKKTSEFFKNSEVSRVNGDGLESAFNDLEGRVPDTGPGPRRAG